VFIDMNAEKVVPVDNENISLWPDLATILIKINHHSVNPYNIFLGLFSREVMKIEQTRISAKVFYFFVIPRSFPGRQTANKSAIHESSLNNLYN